MKFFDSHAHYYDDWFDEYEGGADALLEKLFSDNVGAIVNVSTNPKNLALCIEQAKRFEGMYVTAGIHPEDCPYLENVDAALAEIESIVSDARLLKENKIVAIGEIGFDYHVEGLNDEVKAVQRYCFEYQMRLAERSAPTASSKRARSVFSSVYLILAMSAERTLERMSPSSICSLVTAMRWLEVSLVRRSSRMACCISG